MPLSSWPSSPVPNLDASIGQTVRATAADMLTENASTKPNSENRLPTKPGMKDTGMKTAARVAVVESTEKTISCVHSTAAARPGAHHAMPGDVLDDDDRVIDDETGGDHERQ